MADRRTLYHGSVIPVPRPLARVGREDIDFGPGFYVTDNLEQASDWARIKASAKDERCPFVSVYSIDIPESYHINRLQFYQYSVDWLDFISLSRSGQRPWAGYDWIEGGIANDRVIATVDAYLDGFITAEQALNKLVKESVKNQICLRNQYIIDNFLHYQESICLR